LVTRFVAADAPVLNKMLYQQLSALASRTPDKVFVIQGRRRLTYGEIHEQTARLASFLAGKCIHKGDRVAILSGNSPEYIISLLAAQQAGGISVDINFQSTANEIARIIQHCTASVLILENKYGDAVREILEEMPSIKAIITMGAQSQKSSSLTTKTKSSHVSCSRFEDALKSGESQCCLPSVSGDDIASIVYTSGTTGAPKGVVLSHDNVTVNARSIIDYLHLTADDRIMVVLPLCYSYGKSLLTTHLMVGGSMILENSFMYPSIIFDKMIQEEVTGFAGVPSTFAIMLNRSNVRNKRFPKLRYLTQAGGPMPPHHARELSRILPETAIYIMYGQTEATARLTYLPPQDLSAKPGSIGKPIPGVEIELITENGAPAHVGEEGEIVAQGKNIMAGYWDNPEETKKVLRNGKLYTGDMATRDCDGYLYLVGRRSDMIKSGAHRISPKEIEEVISELSEVHEVSVVGAYDEILGETVRAVIVLKDGHKPDEKKIQRHCQAKLASFKIPKEVVYVNELPKTSSGKVQRFLLRNLGSFVQTNAMTGQEEGQYETM
jgi:long-chain acyl-CoA synthetase